MEHAHLCLCIRTHKQSKLHEKLQQAQSYDLETLCLINSLHNLLLQKFLAGIHGQVQALKQVCACGNFGHSWGVLQFRQLQCTRISKGGSKKANPACGTLSRPVTKFSTFALVSAAISGSSSLRISKNHFATSA